MYDGVGRRLDKKTGQLVDIGANSLNGKEWKVLFRNNRDGTFSDVAYPNGASGIEDGRGLSVFDYDRDGRLDLLLRNYRQPAVLLRNRAAQGHWIAFELEGTESNRDAVGARVRVRTEAGWQTREVILGSAYLSSSSKVQHFGLADAARVEEVRIRWPSGAETALGPLDGDRRWRIVEGEDRAVPAPGARRIGSTTASADR